MEVDSDAQQVDFRLDVMINPLRLFTSTLADVLSVASFKVVQRGEKWHLTCSSMDSSKSVYISGALECEAKVEDDTTFTVDTKCFNECVKSLPYHYHCTITRARGAAAICVTSFDPRTESHIKKFELNTHTETAEGGLEFNGEYKYTVELDLVDLRDIVKKALSFGSDDLHFRMEEALPAEYTPGVKYVSLVITSSGTSGSFTEQFNYLTDTKDGPPGALTAEEDFKLGRRTAPTVKVDARYSAHYLMNFLRSERSMLQLLLSQDAGGPMPLIVKKHLSHGDSQIVYMLAPKLVG